ncbi:MAG: MFS transporter [Chloroflexota bacterium]|nr:MFS transporter [Chloroflexota bacterium]
MTPATPPGRSWPRGATALAHRNFRLFWGGQLVSLVGTWMQTVAQGWLVLELTNDPFALGLAAAFQFVPVLVLGLFGGIVADTLPKRPMLIGTQASAMALALVLAALVATGTVQVWHVYLLAALLGVVNALDMPVRQSFVVEMVGRADVANAVALNSAVFNASRIVGPAIAGVLIGTLGIAACFFVNGVSYVAVLLALLAMRPRELLSPPRVQFERTWRGVLGQLQEGLAYVRHTPPVLLAIAVLGIVATVGMNFNVLIPILARDVLRGGADAFGFLMAASGLGSLASALMIAYGQRPTLRLLLFGAGIFGLALVFLSLSRSLPLSLLLMVVLGWGVIAIAATTNTLIQLTVPDELRGRVMSLYTTVFAGSTPLGGLLSGTVAALAGAPAALLVGGVLSVLTAAAAATRLPPARAGVRAAGPGKAS